MTNPTAPRKLLSIESIKLNEDYAVTFAPSDEHQYFLDKKDKDRVARFKQWASIYFYRHLLNINYTLYIEISPAGRLHLHGTIKFKTAQRIRDFYVYDIHKLLKDNQVEIDTISDPDIWATYIQKQSVYRFGVISHKDKIDKMALFDVQSEVVYKKLPFE